jgi:hypothetical protein
LAWDDPQIDDILKLDANAKYIHAADPYWLDDHVKSILTPEAKRAAKKEQ